MPGTQRGVLFIEVLCPFSCSSSGFFCRSARMVGCRWEGEDLAFPASLPSGSGGVRQPGFAQPLVQKPCRRLLGEKSRALIPPFAILATDRNALQRAPLVGSTLGPAARPSGSLLYHSPQKTTFGPRSAHRRGTQVFGEPVANLEGGS